MYFFSQQNFKMCPVCLRNSWPRVFQPFHPSACRGGMNGYRHRWQVRNMVEQHTVGVVRLSLADESGRGESGCLRGMGMPGKHRTTGQSGSGGRNTCLVSTMLREDMHPFQLLVHHLLCTPYLLCATQYTATRTTDMVSPQGGCSLTKKSDIK